MAVLQGLAAVVLFTAATNAKLEPARIAEQQAPETSRATWEAAPAPTAPVGGFDLLKREVGLNTCGFIDGIASSAVTCGGDSECYYNSIVSGIDCCTATADCVVRTACLPSTSSDDALTADLTSTLYCYESDYPECVVYEYGDPQWDGYTLIGCDSVSTTYKFYASTFGPGDESTTTDTETTPITDPTPSPTNPDPDVPTTTVPPPPKKKSSTPIGAIVGGVVGGVVGLALVGVLIFFLVRRSRNNPPQQPPPTNGPPVMAMPYDPRASVAKPPMGMSATETSVSTPMQSVVSPISMSPPPQSPVQPMGQTGSPPPPFYSSGPPQQVWGNQQPTAVEMPTTRSDGQLRELE